jgi:hypothetical protein
MLVDLPFLVMTPACCGAGVGGFGREGKEAGSNARSAANSGGLAARLSHPATDHETMAAKIDRERNRLMATAPAHRPAMPTRAEWSMIILAALIAASVDAVWFSTTAWLQGSSGYVVMQLTGGFWMVHGTARAAGVASFLLGCATHIAVATMMATGFALLRPRLAVLRRPPLVSGTLYGLFLYAVMNGVVLPLRWPGAFPRFAGWSSLGDLLVHVAFGIIFAALIGRSIPMSVIAPAHYE